jgi:hypothetical protein
MSVHENDAGAHFTCLLRALQTAEAKISLIEAKFLGVEAKITRDKQNFVIADAEIRMLKEKVTDLESSVRATNLHFKVPINLLHKEQNSSTINISGYRFFLNFNPQK